MCNKIAVSSFLVIDVIGNFHYNLRCPLLEYGDLLLALFPNRDHGIDILTAACHALFASPNNRRSPNSKMPEPPTLASKQSPSRKKHLEVYTVLFDDCCPVLTLARTLSVVIAKAFRTVGAVFTSVASSYDTMNDLMSLYTHRLWKDGFVRSLNPGVRPSSSSSSEGQRILDIAGGTGDIALRLLDHATHVNNDTKSTVTISDINADMLSAGRARLSSTPYASSGRLNYLEANAEDLSAVESQSIDLYTVAFGIRNFTSIPRTLSEAFRVLRPGGVFACLEFSKVGNPILNAAYKRWSFGAIPLIGQLVAGDRDSYQYLVESIERFPSQEAFEMLIQEAGFVVPRGRAAGGDDIGGGGEGGWENLMGGIACIHKGVKPIR